MQLSCIHCGGVFTISAEQLGGRGRCPHCRGEIILPKAAEEEPQPVEAAGEPSHWREHTISGLGSLAVHLALILCLALIQFGGRGGEGFAEDVLIGEFPSEKLDDQPEQELQAQQKTAGESAQELEEMLDVAPPTEASADSRASESLTLDPPSLTSGDAGSFDLGTVAIGGSSTAGSGWEGLLQNLRRNGLDIVIVFDSTGSMGGEIRQVKQQIRSIGGTLLKLVPKARISLCTYRDRGDDFVVRGLPLTDNISEVERFLADIEADGGGDEPEAVDEGLRWAITNNQFRANARKVILLFGDAPPHAQYRGVCLNLASDFHRQQKGIVSTVTCRRSRWLEDFYDIARAGGGEAFLASNSRQIMEQLIVLVFGSTHRGKVLEAFELMER